ncbi:hypothetical protein LTR96_011798 [Exophiala xenobiotica]|nr:hypothetical protein LTS06_011752 [Exophiala xenobiotica]KAK5262671.1 hypothetical protein LTR96_011798 [Exophiala xenobiotica]KAK5354329.1 Mitochondrial 10-formyltetrahydrofolate dehydrogenase [Exophiala xenobiotica]
MDLLQMNLFIDNETLTIHNPEEDSLVTDKFQAASERDVDKAVAAAKAAFLGWKHTPNSKRSAMMLKYTDLVEQHNDKIAHLESISMGQPI